jgi:hypothetical protein
MQLQHETSSQRRGVSLGLFHVQIAQVQLLQLSKKNPERKGTKEEKGKKKSQNVLFVSFVFLLEVWQ